MSDRRTKARTVSLTSFVAILVLHIGIEIDDVPVRIPKPEGLAHPRLGCRRLDPRLRRAHHNIRKFEYSRLDRWTPVGGKIIGRAIGEINQIPAVEIDPVNLLTAVSVGRKDDLLTRRRP